MTQESNSKMLDQDRLLKKIQILQEQNKDFLKKQKTQLRDFDELLAHSINQNLKIKSLNDELEKLNKKDQVIAALNGKPYRDLLNQLCEALLELYEIEPNNQSKK